MKHNDGPAYNTRSKTSAISKNSKSTANSRSNRVTSAKTTTHRKSAKVNRKSNTDENSSNNSDSEQLPSHILDLIKKLQIENMQLREECDENMIENADIIRELQNECNDKDAQLTEARKLIKRLQTVSKIDEKIEDAIEKFKAKSEQRKKKLVKKESQIKQLELELDDQDKEILAIWQRLKNLGTSMHDKNLILQASKECMKECHNHQEYVEAMIHANNAIHIETMTYACPKILAELYSWKGLLLLELNYQQPSIDASTKALQYQPNCKAALYNRASAYLELEQFANACQDLEKALHLDPNYEEAQNLFDIVQKRINKANQ